VVPNVNYHPNLGHLADCRFHVIDDAILLLVQGSIQVLGRNIELCAEERAAMLVSTEVHVIYEGTNLLGESGKTKHDEVQPLTRIVIDA